MGNSALLMSGNGDRPVVAWEDVRQMIALAFVDEMRPSKPSSSIGSAASLPCRTSRDELASNPFNAEGWDANTRGAWTEQERENGEGRTVQLSSASVRKEREPLDA